MKHAVIGTIETRPGARDEVGHPVVSLTGIQPRVGTELAQRAA